MVPLRDKATSWPLCEQNVNATKAFGRDVHNRADEILRIHTSTNSGYDGFWLPVFSAVSAHMPGAAKAFRNQTPQRIFTRHVGSHHFGDAHATEDIARVIAYLANVPFQVFLSFPIVRDHDTIGVINVNIEQDELKLYNRAELLRLHHTLRPFLVAVEATLDQLALDAPAPTPPA